MQQEKQRQLAQLEADYANQFGNLAMSTSFGRWVPHALMRRDRPCLWVVHLVTFCVVACSESGVFLPSPVHTPRHESQHTESGPSSAVAPSAAAGDAAAGDARGDGPSTPGLARTGFDSVLAGSPINPHDDVGDDESMVLMATQKLDHAAGHQRAMSSDTVELLYDPILACYFDPKTNKFFERKEDALRS